MRSILPLLLSLVCLALLTVGVIGADRSKEKIAKHNERVGSEYRARNLLDSRWRLISPETGIQYRVIQEGTGENHPTRECRVKIHHAGKDIHGRVFEDTWDRKAPEDVTVGGLLSSWQHALTRMVEGDVWEIVTPPLHAYAHFGVARDEIGPNETLIFKIKLISLLSNPYPKFQIPRNWTHPIPPALEGLAEAVKQGKGRP